MVQFKKILVYLHPDAESQIGLRAAEQLARSQGAAVELVATVDEAPWWAETFLSDRIQRWRESFVEQTGQKLEAMAEALRRQGVATTSNVLVGRPWLEVIRQVIRGGFDLLVKQAEGTLPRICDNETDLQLARKCPCPLWLVHPQLDRLQRVAAAIDLVPGDNQDASLNSKIVQLAVWMAQEERCQLHLVRAWSIYGESVLKSHMSEEELAELKVEKRQALQEAIARFLDGRVPEGLTPQVHLPEGASETVIPALFNRGEQDLLVMGTITATGVAGLIIGTTAEQILRHTHCSVLAVKPDGYVSPVKVD